MITAKKSEVPAKKFGARVKQFSHTFSSRVAQWKRAGPITQRSEDQNLALLSIFFYFAWS